MADCSASGTAIDRVIQSAVASTLNQGGNNNASSAAASAATRAIGNFFGGTAATASSSAIMGGGGVMDGGIMGGGASQQQLMPLAPMQTIGSNNNSSSSMMMHQHQQSIAPADNNIIMQQHVNNNRMDNAWAASSTPSNVGMQQPMNNHMMHHPSHQMMSMHHHPPAAQMMMQQQHQQMMMMQQMQMQQHQMAAMVEYQKQRQQQQQHQKKQMMKSQNQKGLSSVNVHVSEPGQSYSAGAQQQQQQQEEDDVATVSEEEQLHHEGITENASIERLAQAWRDAEAEYAQEFDDEGYGEEEYDVSDLGGMYNTDAYQEATTATDNTTTTTNAGGAEPQYDFSEASRTYGCTSTVATDIAPQSLSYPMNLYEQGIQHFDEGNISEAILCFESTLRNIDPEHADAWRMLGKCHTENDEDQKAIVCWLRSLERDPFSPETLLALGVAYVNELDHERAVETLRSWVANHPLYAGMVDENMNGNLEEEDLYGDAHVEEEMLDNGSNNNTRRMRAQTVVEMRDVERLLLRALEYDRTADAAADVYEALGVVYNVSRDYDAAVVCLRRAIDVRPKDYQLRNKLGATLANGNRSDEALPSYRVALSLKPKYARGWLNMAISHSNLHNYSEAARCYLQTLSLNPEARHVWSYLRIALTCDEKWDLLPLAASQNLSAFHDHGFDFVEY